MEKKVKEWGGKNKEKGMGRVERKPFHYRESKERCSKTPKFGKETPTAVWFLEKGQTVMTSAVHSTAGKDIGTSQDRAPHPAPTSHESQ